MRKILFCLICTGLLLSCNSKQANVEQSAESAAEEDSVAAKVDSDSILQQEVKIPKAADEFFNDFIYSFTTNHKYQLSRIVFPLPCVKAGKTSYVTEKQWRFTKLHMSTPVYTVFFDRKSSLQLEKNKKITEVRIDRFFMLKKLVRTYFFKKLNNSWMLTQIEELPLQSFPDHEFINFYQRFATDSVFQMEHVKDEISFSSPDPNDEFERMDGVLDAEQWPSFSPELPANVFTNIDYGQSLKFRNRRMVALESSSSGFLCLLYFVKEDGRWMLNRLEN